MAISRPRWVALLWVLGMGSLALSLWASAALVPGAITWQEAVWALLFGSAFLAVGAVLVVRRPAAVVGRICLLTGLDDGGGGRPADVRDPARPPARRRSPRSARSRPTSRRSGPLRRPHPRRRPARAVPGRSGSRAAGRPSPTSPSCLRRSASSASLFVPGAIDVALAPAPDRRTRSGSRRSRPSTPATFQRRSPSTA